MDTTELVNAVAAVELDAPVDVLADAVGKVENARRFLKELAGSLDAALLAYVAANGPFTIGTVRYYAGTEKVTRVRDHRAALEAVLVATGGDVDAVAETLSANAFKPGACRSVLGDGWDEVFEVWERKTLKEGEPDRKLLKADTRFLD